MKKVFLLLRNNSQLGPFTIDELMQQKLSADDLIWVEGFSLAWALPSELDLLKLSNIDTAPHTDARPSATDTNQTVAKPINNKSQSPLKSKKKRKWADEDIEGRAEEIRKRTLEYISNKSTATSPLITDDEIRSFTKTPDINFVVHKRRRRVSPNLIGASLVALMLVAGWYGKDKLFIAQNNSDILSTQDIAPQVIPISSSVQLQPSENASAAFISEEVEDTIVTEESENIQKPYSSPAKPIEQPIVVASTSDVNQKSADDIKTEKQQVKETEDHALQAVKKETATVTSKPDSSKAKTDSSKAKVETKTIEETEESTDKKKTLGQAIKGIFKKKKKDKDTDDETEENN
jgi:hypothetical protein